MSQRPRRRRLAVRLFAVALVAEVIVLWQRGYGIGGKVVVRCREGHMFTTIWIPGASVKSLRLGWWRFQRCPVAKHWSLVTPVAAKELTDEERRLVLATRDSWIP